jgi:hypothetical protein
MKVGKLLMAGLVVAGMVGSSYGLPKMKIPGASGADAPAVDTKAMQADLDKSVLEIGLARKLLLEAQYELAIALGAKEEADKILSAANALKDGSVVQAKDADAIEKQIATSKDLTAVTDAAAAKAAPLTEEGKEHFKKGQALFAKGLTAEAGQIAVIGALAVGIKDQATQAKSNPMAAAKLTAMAVPAAKLASLLPGDVKAGINTYSLIKKVGADNNIEVEKVDTANLLTGAQ